MARFWVREKPSQMLLHFPGHLRPKSHNYTKRVIVTRIHDVVRDLSHFMVT